MKRFAIRLRHYSGGLFALASLLVIASVPVHANPIMHGLRSGSNFNFGASPHGSSARSTPHTPATAPSQQQTTKARPLRYTALGDSVAAGLGLPLNPTSHTDSRCSQSRQAYPSLVANQLHATLTDAACSGAKSGDLVTVQTEDGPNVPAQFDTMFAAGKPDIITLTVGANDIHWTDFVRTCYATNCDTTASSFAVDTLLTAYKLKIHYALYDLYVRSNGAPPMVLMTGYYKLGTDRCLESIGGPRITAGEVIWLNQQTDKLNAAIQSAASDFYFADYVPVDFSRHGLCASGRQRWVQDTNEPAPFHPTAAGQAAIAKAVFAALDH